MTEAGLPDAASEVYRKVDDSGGAAILRDKDTNTPADFFLKHQQKGADAAAKAAKAPKPSDIKEDWTSENSAIGAVMSEDAPQLTKELLGLQKEGGELTFLHKTGKIDDAAYQQAMGAHQDSKGVWLGKAEQSRRDNQFRQQFGTQLGSHPDDYDKTDQQRFFGFGNEELGKRDKTIPVRLSDTRTEGYAGKGITVKETTQDFRNPDGTKTTTTVKAIDPYDLQNRVQSIKSSDDKMSRALQIQFTNQQKSDPNGTINIPNGYDASGKEKYVTKKNSEASYDDFLTAKVMNEVGAKMRTSQVTTLPKTDQSKTSSGTTYTAGNYQYDYLKNNDGKEEVTVKKTKGGKVEPEIFTDRDGKQFEGVFSGYEYNPQKDGDKNIKIFVDKKFDPVQGIIRVDKTTGKQLKKGENSASGKASDLYIIHTQKPQTVRVTVPPTNENMGKAKFGGVSFWDIRDAMQNGKSGTINAGQQKKSSASAINYSTRQTSALNAFKNQLQRDPTDKELEKLLSKYK